MGQHQLVAQPVHHLSHQTGLFQGHDLCAGDVAGELGGAERRAEGQLVEDGAGIVGEHCETGAEQIGEAAARREHAEEAPRARLGLEPFLGKRQVDELTQNQWVAVTRLVEGEHRVGTDGPREDGFEDLTGGRADSGLPHPDGWRPGCATNRRPHREVPRRHGWWPPP